MGPKAPQTAGISRHVASTTSIWRCGGYGREVCFCSHIGQNLKDRPWVSEVCALMISVCLSSICLSAASRASFTGSSVAALICCFEAVSGLGVFVGAGSPAGSVPPLPPSSRGARSSLFCPGLVPPHGHHKQPSQSKAP